MNTQISSPIRLKIALFGFLMMTLVHADQPAWSVNPVDYSSSANVRASLYVDEVLVDDPATILGAFVGETCRGVAQSVNILDTWIFFLTVYANTDGEELSFKAYIAGEDVVVPITETIIFSNGSNYGSAYDPIILNAVIYLDHAPAVADIPDQEIPAGASFADFDLDDYLIELDGNPVAWSASGQTELLVSIDSENIVTIQAPTSDWSGSEQLTFTATDLTEQGLFGYDMAQFTVLPFDHPPEVSDIPDQMVPAGETFTDIALDDYLIELDGDQISWSYSFMPPLVPDPLPDWSVDPGNYELSMTITARIMAQGMEPDSQANLLAAFAGSECRGVVTPIFAIDSWYYFLTVFADQNGEEITLKFYDSGNSIVLPVSESFVFVNNFAFGSPLNHEMLHAEFLHVTIDSQNIASVEIMNPDWSGSETIIYTATDQNTWNSYSASDYVTYSYTGQFDLPPFINPIPDQVVDEGDSFTPFDLDDFLLELDGDPVFWTVSGNTDLSVLLDADNLLTVTPPDENWFGSEQLLIAVTDDTPYQLSDLTAVQFTVSPVNDAPFPVSGLTDLLLLSGTSADFSVDLFDDIEGDPLFYSVTSSDESVAAVSLVGILGTVLAVRPGEAELTVSADDGNGGIGSIQFNVIVTCDGTIDCNGDCNGTAGVDGCGICSGGNTNHEADSDIDCNGDCFGLAAIDACGICSGGNTGHIADSDLDCHGDCFGTAFPDDCGVCSGGNTGHEANSDLDLCNVCPDGSMGSGSDDPAPDGYSYGNGSDCVGDCFGTAGIDNCGVCSSGNSGHEADSDMDCNGDCFGNADPDACGVCSSGNSGHEADSDIDCNGDCFGPAFPDDCGVCSNGNSGHEANSEIDDCNVCPDGSMGSGSNDPAPEGYDFGDGPDCSGDCFGTAFIDDCGVCSAGSSGHEPNSDMDCNGDCFGSAEPDACGVCSGGNSNHEDGSDIDCNGDCFGTALENECGCIGGNTGLSGDACYGCTDPLAVNFDPSANLEDDSCAYAGDFNGDGTTDVSDVVLIVDWIISNQLPTDDLLLTCDLTGEGEITVVDLVLIIQLIIGDYGMVEPLVSASLLVNSGLLSLKASGTVSALQIRTEGDFTITETNLPPGWEMHRNRGRILIFTFNGPVISETALFHFSGTLRVMENQITDKAGNAVSATVLEIPETFSISRVSPNPFNPVTSLTIDLPNEGYITLAIYDVSGGFIRNLLSEYRAAGSYQFQLDGRSLTSGVYFIRLTLGHSATSRKVLLLK